MGNFGQWGKNASPQAQESANNQGIWATLKDGVTALNNLAKTLGTVFPLASSSITTTATGGSETLPANPTGFLTITVDGVSYKVPLYEP